MTQTSAGWFPLMRTEVWHGKLLVKVVDWKDGTGEKPAVPFYLGERGLVVDAVDATDIGLQRGL